MGTRLEEIEKTLGACDAETLARIEDAMHPPDDIEKRKISRMAPAAVRILALIIRAACDGRVAVLEKTIGENTTKDI